MARPKAPELTERELEVMHVFWDAAPEPLSAAAVRDRLAGAGRDLAYTTVATLVRILHEKEFLRQINEQRPFAYEPVRSFDEVSRRLVGNLIDRVFQGSREQLLVRLLETRRLTAKERSLLEGILREKKS
jgi:predicted transcriptional regulator